MVVLAEGQIFAHYHITRRLGKGISGESYEAEDTRFLRTVTLKLLHPWAMLPNTTQRHFFREMQAISTFSHPYLATVLDYGEYGGQLYVTRRYTSSGSLLGDEGRRYYSPPLPPTRAIQITYQLAQALDHIHQHGYVHGSLTFANLLLLNQFQQADEQDYSPFLIADIGLAHFVRRFGQPETNILPATAAPEQLGQRVVAASDQYALAVLLYFWLTGMLPFSGPVEEVEQLKLSGTLPSAVTSNPEVTLLQEDILQRALNVYPEERYPSTLAFAEALVNSLHTPSAPSLQDSFALLSLLGPSEHAPASDVPSTPMPDLTAFVPSTPPLKASPPIELADQNPPEGQNASRFEELLLALSHFAPPIDNAPTEQQGRSQSPDAPQNSQAAPSQAETTPGPVIIPEPEPNILTPRPEPMQAPEERAPSPRPEQEDEPYNATPFINSRQVAYFVISSPYSDKPYTAKIDRANTTIGRAGASNILLDHDSQTSRHQALLKHDGEAYLLYDLHSAYGTYLNGQKLTSSLGYPLHDGDHITIGVYELVFHLSTEETVDFSSLLIIH